MQNGFDLGEMVESVGNTGFHESGFANFHRVEFVARHFISRPQSIIEILLQVKTAMDSLSLRPFSLPWHW